jgi:hypothetical protein
MASWGGAREPARHRPVSSNSSMIPRRPAASCPCARSTRTPKRTDPRPSRPAGRLQVRKGYCFRRQVGAQIEEPSRVCVLARSHLCNNENEAEGPGVWLSGRCAVRVQRGFRRAGRRASKPDAAANHRDRLMIPFTSDDSREDAGHVRSPGHQPENSPGQRA